MYSFTTSVLRIKLMIAELIFDRTRRIVRSALVLDAATDGVMEMHTSAFETILNMIANNLRLIVVLCSKS